ncbi:MAG: TIGR02646 family protein [Desulfosarcina sp.]|nr:TIGR02646 family protein [Desulfosarcina sp.]MBC2742849.1 TIGR02646 family protein [Desulfosarcina sp.]MBC2765759.1 TIGR02646 family protein [Desulfosarcina sp.]
MRAITKGAEPRSLMEHRAGAHCDYDNYQDKEELRQALVAEQRGLCCYCMGRIRRDRNGMKIEHWRCRSANGDQELVYRNLLGACLGGQGQAGSKQHCDTCKEDRDLKWNPSDPAHRIEDRLEYELDGTIRALDDEFNTQLNEVLNLNMAWLKNNRKGVLTAVLDWWRMCRRPVSPARIEREIQKRTDGATGLPPYCQVAVWWLRMKLAGMV